MIQPDNTHLAQLNVGRAVDDMESDRMAEFVRSLDHVNGLAEKSDGFVWRLQDDTSGGAVDLQVTDDPRFLVNLTVWETPEHLERFVWNTVHKNFYARRERWFEKLGEAHFVMWWVPKGHVPTADEALERLEDLRANGPSDRAFGWESLESVQMWKQARCG